jgi:2-haloacid dehalogenase
LVLGGVEEPLSLKQFGYLTFDCYGTLIDWRSGIESALAEAFGDLPKRGTELAALYGSAEREQERSYKEYRMVLADTAMALGKTLGKELSRSRAWEFAASVPRWPAFPDTASSLKRLGELGFRRFILSNVDTDLLEETISRQGLEVDGYVTAQETRSYKPAHGHWERLMTKTGANKNQTLHVAQSIYHDIIPAQEMGITSAWVNRYGEPLHLEAKPDYLVDSLDSLAGLLS